MKQEFLRIRATMRKPQWTWWTMALWSPEGGALLAQGQRQRKASGQDQASCAGHVTYMTAGLQSQPQVSPWPRVRFPCGRDSPLPGSRGVTEPRDCQQPGFQPFPLSQKWLCFKNALVGDGYNMLLWVLCSCAKMPGRGGAEAQNQSPGLLPLSDCFSKAHLTSGQPGGASFFPSRGS